MEANKLITACAVVMAVAGFGIVGDVLACGGAAYAGPFNESNAPEGLGTLTYPNGNVLEATFEKGKITPITPVTVTTLDGDVYKGRPGGLGLKQGMKEVNDMTIYSQTQHAGEFPTGFGTITYANGDLFDGFFENGQPEHGTMTYAKVLAKKRVDFCENTEFSTILTR
ncbi:hypothetical protein FACS189449_02840 [Alphaproteobacteria bacterium]|nr:hypothetical protein FACS189449_02840 [Alphaproteobacteria bacterium]